MTDSPTKTAEQVKFEVDSIHHIHGSECLCGFKSGRSRSRTEHITEALLSALAGSGLLVSGAPSEEQIERALDSWAGGGFVSTYPESVQYWWPKMRAALTAAGVGSPATVDRDGQRNV